MDAKHRCSAILMVAALVGLMVATPVRADVTVFATQKDGEIDAEGSGNSGVDLGDPYQDGICVEPDGCSGSGALIAAKNDAGPAKWGTYDYATGATSDSNGPANTSTVYDDVQSDNGTWNSSPNAAVLCTEKSSTNYNDWYLPAKSELDQLYQNQGSVGGFDSTYYWSSTEGDKEFAWSQNFSDGNNIQYAKSNDMAIRCV